MTDAQLHELLKDNGYTLAVLKGDQVVFHSQERGLKPFISYTGSSLSFCGTA